MNEKNNNKFLRRFVISYSALLFIILIMGGYLYSISIKNVSSEIRNQNKLILEKAIHNIDNNFKTMDVLAGQIVTNSNVVRLANMHYSSDTDFYLMAYHAKDELSVYVFTESILPINTYFIYLHKLGYVLSFSQFQSTRIFYIEDYMKDQYENWLDMINDTSLYRQFIPLAPYKKNSDSYFYNLPLDDYSLKNVPATICFEIDYQKLAGLFSELSYFDTGYLCATDDNGNIAFTLSGDQAGEISASTLESLTYTNSFSVYTDNDNKMYVTQAVSDYNHWNYYLVQPADASLYSLKQYRDIFILIIISALVIEFIMILLLSKRNVKPIIQLGIELQDTLTKQKSLQKLAEKQIPVIQYSYLTKIIQGDISTREELEYAQHYLNISSESRKFSVLYMIAYMNQYELYVENSVVTGPDTTNHKDIIQGAVEQFFQEPVYIQSSNDREYSILISAPEQASSEASTAAVREAFTAIHEYLISNHSIWTFAGLGDWNNDLMLTWKSYQQANQAVSYTTKKHILRCYTNIKRETNGFYYPIELTNKLTNFIAVGNKSQVLEIFEILRHENMEERSLPINMMKYLLSDIRNTLYKIRFTLKGTEKNEAELKAIDSLFDQHMSLKLLEDIALSLCGLFDTNSCTNRLIVNIREYINDNYKDPSLCLSKISDEFLISESYFSYLFKEELGENFSSYLERIRMEQSLRLLKKSDINVSLLYQEVGYNNSNSFRRAFKKIYGMSPKDYKIMNFE